MLFNTQELIEMLLEIVENNESDGEKVKKVGELLKKVKVK